MTSYRLDKDLKDLLRQIAVGLEDGSVEQVWVQRPSGIGTKSLLLKGVNGELQKAIDEGRLQQAQLNLLTHYGFILRHDDEYTLVKHQIIDAVTNDFEEQIEILLEDEHIDLFITLVEAALNTTQDKKQEFWTVASSGGLQITHPGLLGGEKTGPEDIYTTLSNIDVLSTNRLLAITRSVDEAQKYFYITPYGFKYYRQLKRRKQQPIERVESSVKGYLNTLEFRARFPLASKKWAEAEDLLWPASGEVQLSTIGHLCREAIQEFAQTLSEEYGIADKFPDKAKVLGRIKEVKRIVAQSSTLSGRTQEFFDALISYWEGLNGIIQQQEHEAQKVGTPIVWIDARRVVFQTAIVMFETSSVIPKRA